MTPARHHAEWLSLVESSGPFLSMPVLLRVFPQGLDLRDPTRAAALRENYEDWLERGRPLAHVHTAWIRHVLENLLEWPADFIAEGQSIPAGLDASQPHFGETLRPDLVLRRPPGTADADTTPQLLVVTYPPGQDLEKPVAGKIWKASPATRMTELLHASGVPLGLVTNGEHWMIVYAPRGETSGFASWYADIWMQEAITLRAFHSLLCLRRFFGVAAGETLAALYAESAKDQQEVTDQLGRQVRRAVEMLVAAFDQIDAESNRTLLTAVPEKEVYDAALTVMMRLVFLFSAEERGLLLLGDPLFDQHYAVSTLRELLRERADQHGEEVLERRHDAWSRLLATFRAVHGGVQHEAMRLPAYGGSLFDPDRFPFLEGRESSSRWRETPSHPLPVNNRVVLHLLEALQLLRVRVPGGGPTEARRVSFRALDIEQIGHVYEGLLDHTARRATEVTLGLDGKNEPEIPLSKLEELAGVDPNAAEPVPLSDERMVAEDRSIVEFPTRKVSYHDTPTAPAALIDFLKDETGRSANALESALGYRKPTARGKAKADATAASAILDLPSSIHDHSLLLACGQDPRLAQRIRPFVGLLRTDDFGRLAVIRPGAVFVTTGTDRRSSGTHYTPKSLTEPIVKHTLDPLVYIGPAEGLPEAEWKLKSPKEILALKVCDLAMGSGAFLVQVCRYLADRLCEAWEIAEKDHAGAMLITPDGDFSVGSAGERLLPNDPAERVALARRYVADRCLYGVDINPMAVEMAKLSLWLITLQKDRPFTFLDHALKCGDSLLGVTSVKQIENFSLSVKPGEIVQDTFATANLFRYVEDAACKRRELEELPSNDHYQIETKSRLHVEAEASIAKVRAIADCLIAFELRCLSGDAYEELRVAEAEAVQTMMQLDADSASGSGTSSINNLSLYANKKLNGHRMFHWAVEFPEVFAHGGFSSFVGNPPFAGKNSIIASGGERFAELLLRVYPGTHGYSDFATYFFRRTFDLCAKSGVVGLLATNTVTQGKSRESGLGWLVREGATIVWAVSEMKWPGTASVVISIPILFKGKWLGERMLDGATVHSISSSLEQMTEGEPLRLGVNKERSTTGFLTYARGFVLSPDDYETLIKAEPTGTEVVFPLLVVDDLTQKPQLSPSLYLINFGTRLLEEARAYPHTLKLVEERVKPERDACSRADAKKYWWRLVGRAEDFFAVVRRDKLTQVLANAHVSKHIVFDFVDANLAFEKNLNLFAYSDWKTFSIIQSSIHMEWADYWASSLGAARRYTNTTCFDTFPFPDLSVNLCVLGQAYHEVRRSIQLSRKEGLTKIYNHLHNSSEKSDDIVRLRALHVEMDQAVAMAYGWDDLDLGHDFHKNKQSIRFTISESARRKVLDRLLALNHQRHAEEIAAGLHDKKSKKAATAKPATKRGRKAKASAPETGMPIMPADFRFPAPSPQLYAVNLVTALLSARPGGLAWPVLRDAFAAVTTPDLMRRLALPEDKDRVAAWASRWNERASPGLLIPTLRDMTSANIAVDGNGTSAVFSLQDGPQEPATEDVGYDAWLALRVTEPLSTPILPDDESAALDAEIEALLTAI